MCPEGARARLRVHESATGKRSPRCRRGRPRPSGAAFLHSLVERGLGGVQLVVSAAHAGLQRAVAQVLGCPMAGLLVNREIGRHTDSTYLPNHGSLIRLARASASDGLLAKQSGIFPAGMDTSSAQRPYDVPASSGHRDTPMKTSCPRRTAPSCIALPT